MIIQGNALTELKKMDADSIDCVITSPPYWSLRKYDIPDVVFDGVEGCEHEWTDKVEFNVSSFEGFHKYEVDGHKNPDVPKRNKTVSQGQFCLHCHAWRGQLGLEPTIDLYLKHLLEIFDEVKRVLKPTGTYFINLGDSYSQSGGSGDPKIWERHKQFGEVIKLGTAQSPHKAIGLPPKSPCLIPERFAIEMVNRGWILRNKIIWKKSNCMPSSAKDRFTVDFEDVFFFVKSKKYWFEQQYENYSESYLNDQGHIKGVPVHKELKDYESAGTQHPTQIHDNAYGKLGQGRNRRCVWTISTQPYPESHFATFPEALVEPMIRAGCPKDGIVLDPFCGSGTVIKVAEKLQRKGIGIDLGYMELAEKRLKNNQMELI